MAIRVQVGSAGRLTPAPRRAPGRAGARARQARDNGEVLSGTAAAGDAPVWAAVGGSPDAIADAFVDEVDRRGRALHGALAEPRARLRNAQAAPDCSTADVDVEGGV